MREIQRERAQNSFIERGKKRPHEEAFLLCVPKFSKYGTATRTSSTFRACSSSYILLRSRSWRETGVSCWTWKLRTFCIQLSSQTKRPVKSQRSKWPIKGFGHCLFPRPTSFRSQLYELMSVEQLWVELTIFPFVHLEQKCCPTRMFFRSSACSVTRMHLLFGLLFFFYVRGFWDQLNSKQKALQEIDWACNKARQVFCGPHFGSVCEKLTFIERWQWHLQINSVLDPQKLGMLKD